ncbi:MAG: nuclease-related domain-containing protein [Candidatus Jordarchaeaceae archaeon]
MDKKAEFLISLLKKLREVQVFDHEEFRKMVGDPKLFDLLITKGYNNLAEQRVSFNLESKLEISLAALEYGADIGEVCKLLSWKEFEAFTKSVLEKNNYYCIQNFRFKHNKKQYEIDVVGLKEPFILCIDSKHYKKSGKNHILRTYCEKQIERVEALSKILSEIVPKLRITKWKEAKIIPLIVTLLPEQIVPSNVPIVPFFKLNSFIIELSTHLSEIYQVNIKLPRYTIIEDYRN